MPSVSGFSSCAHVVLQPAAPCLSSGHCCASCLLVETPAADAALRPTNAPPQDPTLRCHTAGDSGAGLQRAVLSGLQGEGARLDPASLLSIFPSGSTCLAAWQCTICCPLAAAHAGADGHVALCPNPYVCKRAEQPVEIYYAERPAACCIHLPQITARAAPFESKPCLAHTAAGARYQQVLSGMVIVS